MTTDGHGKGSKVSHRKLSNEEFDRELVMMKVHINALMEMMQESEEDYIVDGLYKGK